MSNLILVGRSVKEAALFLDTAKGLVVITGCAHPDVANMVERAKVYRGENICLVMGGFHLGGSPSTCERNSSVD